jgi:CRISPR system Cascade subunit CasE
MAWNRAPYVSDILLRRGRPRSRGSKGTNDRELLPVGLLQKGASGQQGGSPDAVFTGTLVVARPAEFMGLLARGIGRHRAFGYGMLLLRPPRRGS